MENNIEEFLEATADWLDTKKELEMCENSNRDMAYYYCDQYDQAVDSAKQKAEAAMKKVIRTELKIAGAE